MQAIVTQHHQQVTLGAPHALRAVIGTALFLTVLGVLAVGLGALVRNTAGGIASFVGLLFVLPGIIALLPASTADAINPYLPLNAGFAVATSTFENSHHLSPWTGFAVFCGYAALAVVAAAVGAGSGATPERRHRAALCGRLAGAGQQQGEDRARAGARDRRAGRPRRGRASARARARCRGRRRPARRANARSGSPAKPGALVGDVERRASRRRRAR